MENYDYMITTMIDGNKRIKRKYLNKFLLLTAHYGDVKTRYFHKDSENAFLKTLSKFGVKLLDREVHCSNQTLICYNKLENTDKLLSFIKPYIDIYAAPHGSITDRVYNYEELYVAPIPSKYYGIKQPTHKEKVIKEFIPYDCR